MNQNNTARPITQSNFSRSPVDIIIPFHGQYDKVSRLVKSILKATLSNPYQICLVDDASPNAEFIKEMKSVAQTITIRNEKQLGFGGSLKVGFNATEQPWVVFLNSDCHIEQAGWLIEMGRSLLELKPKGVKMVSARSNNPGVGCDQLKADINTVSEDYILQKPEFLPLYCAMCHRELFNHIGGFIKNYPLMFEDEELAARMRKYGYKQAVCGKSWVSHEGGATLDRLYADSHSKYMDKYNKSREMCVADLLKVK